MDLIDQAVYDLIHGYPGGAPALSSYLYSQYGYKVKPGTLMNKANPDQPHEMKVREGVLIQRAQQRFHLLYAEASQLNHSAIELGDFSQTSDIELLNTYTKVHREMGDVATELHNALVDGRITRNEVRRIRKETGDTIRALLEMCNRFEALCDEPKASSYA